MRNRKTTLALSVLLIIALLAAGCVSKPGSNQPSKGEQGNNTATEGQGATGKQQFRLNLSTEPPTLDPAQAQDQISGTVLNGIFEGLTRVNEQAEVVPAVAKSWVISEDGTKYTFQLRDDVKWSNGDKVTAQDFEFAWKRVLNPDLKPKASPYAYMLYYIKGAEDYNSGKGSVDDVAVKATDEHTLEVEINTATPYFLSVVSFVTYYPVHSSVTDNPAFASKADTLISNGAFKMSDWKKGTSITIAKNENYYDIDNIKLDSVHFTMVNDAGSEVNMYKTDIIDYAGKPTGVLPTDQLESLKADHPDEFKIKSTAGLNYYIFNTTKKPFDNVKVRQAMSMAISRSDLTEKVTRGQQVPAYGMVPPGISGEKDDFRTEYPDNYFTEDYEAAKQLLAEGLQESGLSEMPEFSLLYNTNEINQKVAEAIVEMWRVNLGINASIGNQEWNVFLDNRRALNYEVARSAWGADYNDPITFIDLYTTTGGNNDIGYSNPAYDALVAEVNNTSDQAVRMKKMAEAEKLLMEDRPVIPLFYDSAVYMLKPGFKNIYIDFKGDIQYVHGYYEAP
ncbi:ABC transporter substrate-binding protein [Paenibacillus yanchengensis]|uniref:ABC transporter substrate-binding protein n=1 Tax=Paenibacillus yanchengensis TaxID=2035833 RepID=A0ABW4YNH7_9BACL